MKIIVIAMESFEINFFLIRENNPVSIFRPWYGTAKCQPNLPTRLSGGFFPNLESLKCWVLKTGHHIVFLLILPPPFDLILSTGSSEFETSHKIYRFSALESIHSSFHIFSIVWSIFNGIINNPFRNFKHRKGTTSTAFYFYMYFVCKSFTRTHYYIKSTKCILKIEIIMFKLR